MHRQQIIKICLLKFSRRISFFLFAMKYMNGEQQGIIFGPRKRRLQLQIYKFLSYISNSMVAIPVTHTYA